MSLENFFYRVEERVLDAGRYLLNQRPRDRAGEAAAGLAAELEDQAERLAKALTQLEVTRKAKAEHEARVTFLKSQIEALVKIRKTDAAYALAMEMDEVRQALADCQTRLPKQEQLCWSLEFKLRQMERRLDRVRQQQRAKG